MAGEFQVGTRLPPERDLAVQLGVSRPSLREALIALEVEGYIEVRMGSGIYVCELPASPEAEFDLAVEEAPLELIRARALLEGEVAALAARVGRKKQFDAIEDAIDMMQREAEAGRKPIDADKLFHVRIAEATGNSVLVGVVRRLFDARLGPLFDQLHSHFETADVWAQAIAEHRDVLEALRSKDPEQARSAMRRHMEIAFKRLTSSLMKAPRGRAKKSAQGRSKGSAKGRAVASAQADETAVRKPIAVGASKAGAAPARTQARRKAPEKLPPRTLRKRAA